MINCMVGSKRPQSLEPVCSRTPHTLILSLYALHLVLIYPHLILTCHPSCPYMPSILSLHALHLVLVLYCTHTKHMKPHYGAHKRQHTSIRVCVWHTTVDGRVVCEWGRVEKLFVRMFILSCTFFGAVYLSVFGQERLFNQRLATTVALEALAVPMPCHVVMY